MNHVLAYSSSMCECVRNGLDMCKYCTLLRVSREQYGMIPVLACAVAGPVGV